MSERTYTTDIDLQSGSVHLSLTDAEMIAFVHEHVSGPLVGELIALIDRHGAQQVMIALAVASCMDQWRRDNPERWEAAIAKAQGVTDA